MLAKARIVVDGVVQGVGYRALVKQVARQFGLKGLVRNFEETKVEIFCEGPKEKIKQFLKNIDRKAKPEDFLSINVTEINCFWEGQENYQPAWKEYKGFEIDYRVEELSLFQEATLDDHEYGKLYFAGFRDEMQGLRGEMVGFREELRGFREDTDNNFKEMAEKYGDISKELKEFRETVKKFLDAFLSELRKGTVKHNATIANSES